MAIYLQVCYTVLSHSGRLKAEADWLHMSEREASANLYPNQLLTVMIGESFLVGGNCLKLQKDLSKNQDILKSFFC